MSETTSMFDQYENKGAGTSFVFGINEPVKVDSWSIETNERSLKQLVLKFAKPNPGSEDGKSLLYQYINFSIPPQNSNEVNPKAVGVFFGIIKSFATQFVTEEQFDERKLAAEVKIKSTFNIQSFSLDNVVELHRQLEMFVQAIFDLLQNNGLLNVGGKLVCGYNQKGYYTPFDYGTSGVYHSAFYVKDTPQIPGETDKFFHTKPAQNSASNVNTSTSSTTDTGW